jgi:hypothetical protein
MAPAGKKIADETLPLMGKVSATIEECKRNSVAFYGERRIYFS